MHGATSPSKSEQPGDKEPDGTSSSPPWGAPSYAEFFGALHTSGRPRQTDNGRPAVEGEGEQTGKAGKSQSSPRKPVTYEDLLGWNCPPLEDVPTTVMYEALRQLRHHAKKGARIRQLVKYLADDRGEKINPFLLEAIAVANWDVLGSAAELWTIYRALGTGEIQASVGFYHSMLRVCHVTISALMLLRC
jgi:hypothetical protein